jgi:hypothetical protein
MRHSLKNRHSIHLTHRFVIGSCPQVPEENIAHRTQMQDACFGLAALLPRGLRSMMKRSFHDDAAAFKAGVLLVAHAPDLARARCGVSCPSPLPCWMGT